MEIISSLGLVLIILLALNHMAGGKPSNVLNPVGRLCSRILGLALGIVGKAVSGLIGMLGGSVKSISPPPDRHEGGSSEKPLPRW